MITTGSRLRLAAGLLREEGQGGEGRLRRRLQGSYYVYYY